LFAPWRLFMPFVGAEAVAGMSLGGSRWAFVGDGGLLSGRQAGWSSPTRGAADGAV